LHEVLAIGAALTHIRRVAGLALRAQYEALRSIREPGQRVGERRPGHDVENPHNDRTPLHDNAETRL
jgi:hypothetical protein